MNTLAEIYAMLARIVVLIAATWAFILVIGATIAIAILFYKLIFNIWR